MQGTITDFSQIQKLGKTISVVTAWWRSVQSSYTHSIWILSNTLHMYEEEVVTIPCESGAWITASWLHLVQGSHTGFHPNSKTRDNNICGNSMIEVQSLHPKHMNDVKHLAYVWRGCRDHSMKVWCLNHCIITWFGTRQSPTISAKFKNTDKNVLFLW